MHHLVWLPHHPGPYASVLVPAGQVLRVGRHSDNDIRLHSPSVSRFHVNVVSDGTVVRVRDRMSCCGFSINGVRAEPEAVLRPGDELRVGSRELWLERLPAVEASWLAWADGAVPRLARSAREDLRLLPLLADALEDAGCVSADWLGRLREPGDRVGWGVAQLGQGR